MKTKAAVLWEVNTPWSIEEVELDPPGPGEVLVKIAASGMCHSDEHLVTGDLPFALPIIGGHEGAGVVVLEEYQDEYRDWLKPVASDGWSAELLVWSGDDRAELGLRFHAFG